MRTKAILERAVAPLVLPAVLARFFRRSASVPAGLASLRAAMATRDERFLAMVRTEICGRPASIYARLLAHAGCTYGDVLAMVRADGLEAALERLAAAGVRLTDAEFRGRVDVERGGRRWRVHVDDLVPSRFGVGLVANSSGSGGSPLPCLFPVGWMALEACIVEAFLGAHGLRAHTHATDDARLAGGAGPKFMAYLGRHGLDAVRWFVRDQPLHGTLLRAYHAIVARELAAAARLHGRTFARPTVANDGDVLAWIAEERRAGRSCCLRTAVSRAVDVARAALAAGSELRDTVFVVSGEPLTPARRKLIEQTGARVVPQYGFIPGGLLGVGCGRPASHDDMHVMAHTMAVVGAPESVADGRRRLLVTALHPHAGAVLLNVENGDLAAIADRDCGCLLGAQGLRRHVSAVGSDRQLTLGGCKYAVDDLVAVVEEALPRACGGGPGDYQLVEEHDGDGRGHLTLRVHPRLGARDGDALLAVLRRELARGARGHRAMTAMWSEAGALRVVHEAPATSPRGKVSPVVPLASAADPGRSGCSLEQVPATMVGHSS